MAQRWTRREMLAFGVAASVSGLVTAACGSESDLSNQAAREGAASTRDTAPANRVPPDPRASA